MTDDPAWPLAQHVCRSGYADLPASAVESARRDILDTFGCMLGGSRSPGIDELFAVISRWGGLPESRVLLRGTRLPAPQAALLNAGFRRHARGSIQLLCDPLRPSDVDPTHCLTHG